MNAPSLMLDARRRAMLEDMGIRLWWPAGGASHGATGLAGRTVATPRTPPARPADPLDAPGGPTDSVAPAVPRSMPPAPGPAAPVAAAPRAVPSAGVDEACVEPALRLDGGAVAPEGGWLIVADMPPGADGRHPPPLEGDAGRLLDNMLRALRLRDDRVPLHLMRAHRPADRAAAADTAVAPVRDAVAASAATLRPCVVLAMGPISAQALLQRAEPLGRLRGEATALAVGEGRAPVPVVVTYHPAYLLRNPADKARAWADLCLAASHAQPG